jgi:hypothetical protein
VTGSVSGPVAGGAGGPVAGGRRRVALLVSVVGAAMVALDGTVLIVAQPSIGRDLGATVGQVQWTGRPHPRRPAPTGRQGGGGAAAPEDDLRRRARLS